MPSASASASAPSPAASLAALCAAFVARTQAELDEAGIGPNGEPFGAIQRSFKKPFCREISLGRTFRGDGTWKSVKAVRAGGGFVDAARLVVERPLGWEMTSIAWDDSGRTVRATPEFEPLGLASVVVVKDGTLEVTVDGVALVFTGTSGTKVPAQRTTRCTAGTAQITCTPLSHDAP